MTLTNRLLTAVLFCLVCLGVAPPAQALDLDNLSASDRALLHEEIRSYLLENPEIIMEAVSVLERRQAATQAEADVQLVRANSEALFDAPHDWTGGNPEGDVTLVEFMDYKCGYCRRAFDDVNSLVEEDGNIRLVLKEFPVLGEESVAAARFAIATRRVAGDDAYKSVHDALMAYNGTMNETGFSRLADALGLDANAIIDEMDSDAVTEVIAANHALGRRLRVSGTPTFVMDDQMLRGFVPQDAMQRIANELRAQ
ncbi:DsbA family protein [Roseovarius ramblicola]|uniref:DsbA family protein n=1 Tax=Roseovarius ramblicola TaxID=2022336 RepID=A0ABV5I354_9RHOB